MANQPADIIYMDQKGKITQRTIFVKKVDKDQVITFCSLREQQRTFYLENILAVEKHSDVKRCAPKLQVESNQVHRFLEN